MGILRKNARNAAWLSLLLGAVLAMALSSTAYAAGSYQQVIGTSDGANPNAVASQFEFTSGISADYDATKVVWEDTSSTADANALVGTKVNGNSTVPFKEDQPVTVRIPDGFTYLNGQKYDIHIRITPNNTVTNLDWLCNFDYKNNTCYMTLTPSYHNRQSKDDFDYNYEIWLTNGSTANTTAAQDIKIVGGSCYMAYNERCRPFSDDGLIYTKVAKKDLVWSAANNAWIVQDSGVNNKADHYVLGHGTEMVNGNAVLKGAYGRTNTGGQSELVLGYLNYEISLDKQTTNTPNNAAGYTAGETIQYTVKVTNEGTDTLSDVKVADGLAGVELVSVTLFQRKRACLDPIQRC